jgi:hypothetical protein
MFCAKCGTTIDDNSYFCQRCGTPVNQPVMISPANLTSAQYPYNTTTAHARVNGMSVASLVLGIVGLIPYCYFVPAVLAIIFGAVGIGQVNRSFGTYKGKGMAIAGLVLGIVSIVFWVFIIILVGFSMLILGEASNGLGSYSY